MRVFLVTVGLGLLATASLSFWADPARRWHRSVELPERPLSPGQAWVWPSDNLEDRALKRRFIELQEAPTVAVFGSSRAMLFNSDSVRTARLANLGVAGASVQDFLGFWELMKLRQKTSPIVLILADPWIFNANGHDDRWRALEKLVDVFEKGGSFSWTSGVPFLGAAATRAALAKVRFDETLDLLSAQTVRASLVYFKDRLRRRISPDVTGGFQVVSLDAFPATGNGSRWDGARVYPEGYVRPPDEQAARERAAVFMAEVPWYHLRDYTIDEASVSRLMTLLEDLARHGVKAYILLPPYHPDVVAGMNSHPIYKRVIPLFREAILRAAKGVRAPVDVCDALEPRTVGCARTEFLDGMHPLASCVDKVAARCLRRWGL